jgi:hypothetical protein
MSCRRRAPASRPTRGGSLERLRKGYRGGSPSKARFAPSPQWCILPRVRATPIGRSTSSPLAPYTASWSKGPIHSDAHKLSRGTGRVHGKVFAQRVKYGLRTRVARLFAVRQAFSRQAIRWRAQTARSQRIEFRSANRQTPRGMAESSEVRPAGAIRRSISAPARWRTATSSACHESRYAERRRHRERKRRVAKPTNPTHHHSGVGRPGTLLHPPPLVGAVGFRV